MIVSLSTEMRKAKTTRKSFVRGVVTDDDNDFFISA